MTDITTPTIHEAPEPIELTARLTGENFEHELCIPRGHTPREVSQLLGRLVANVVDGLVTSAVKNGKLDASAAESVENSFIEDIATSALNEISRIRRHS